MAFSFVISFSRVLSDIHVFLKVSAGGVTTQYRSDKHGYTALIDYF